MSLTLAPNGPEKWGCRMRIRTYLVKFETYLIKFETYSVLRDYETEKTTGAPAPAAPASLAPMVINIFGVTIQAQMRKSLGRSEIKQKKASEL